VQLRSRARAVVPERRPFDRSIAREEQFGLALEH